MISAIAESLLNVVFPPLCRACEELLPGRGTDLMCETCLTKAKPLAPPLCATCGAPVEEDEAQGQKGPQCCRRCPGFEVQFKFARSAFDYAPPVRDLIHQFKFRGSERVRGLLLEWFLKGADRHLKREEFDAVAPVPLHWWRRFQREFNQAEILGRPLAARWSLPFLPRALRRTRYTQPQSRLKGKWRERNIEGAFAPGRDPVQGLRVLLVDDVMTTGRTLSACAETLLKAGAASVAVYTLARRLT